MILWCSTAALWVHKSWKKWSVSRPKAYLKNIHQTMTKNDKKRYPKRGPGRWFFCYLLRSRSKGVPGWSQGGSQGVKSEAKGGPRDPPRVPPGSKLLQNWPQNDSKIINKCCPEAFWKRFSKTHALSMFLNSSGLFLVCSYSCRGRLSVTFIQVKSQHSSTWLGGKTYGGCLPDASQMSPRCLSTNVVRRLSENASQKHTH